MIGREAIELFAWIGIALMFFCLLWLTPGPEGLVRVKRTKAVDGYVYVIEDEELGKNVVVKTEGE